MDKFSDKLAREKSPILIAKAVSLAIHTADKIRPFVLL